MAERVVENPMGLSHFVDQADGLTLGILVILVAMSLASWYVTLIKFWDQRRIEQSYKEARKKFWAAGNLHDGLSALTGRDNVFRMLAEDGVRAAQYYEGHLSNKLEQHEWIAASLYRSIESVTNKLSSYLAILATTGSISPFIGLLGTVWGIYNALTRISMSSGQPSLQEIGGPIGEALIMTAIGLFVAVPAVIGYNWLLRRNRGLQEKMKAFTADVHTYLVGGARFDVEAPIARPRRASTSS